MGWERVLDASVAGVLAGKRDGVVDRCGNDGGVSCWWSSLVRNKRKTLSEISALFESHLFPLDKGRSYLQQRLIGISTLMDLYGVLDQFLITTTIYLNTQNLWLGLFVLI